MAEDHRPPWWINTVFDLYHHYIDQHHTSSLKLACHGFNEISGSVPENTLRSETHYFIENHGFKWDKKNNCFINVDRKIYQNSRAAVDSALRKYADYCKNHF